jgi:hypothetical protein
MTRTFAENVETGRQSSKSNKSNALVLLIAAHSKSKAFKKLMSRLRETIPLLSNNNNNSNVVKVVSQARPLHSPKRQKLHAKKQVSPACMPPKHQNFKVRSFSDLQQYDPD